MSANKFESINPATEKLLRTFTPASAAETDAALRTADRAYQSWKVTAHGDRLKLIGRLGHELRQGSAASAMLISQEMGKPIVQARAEVEKCAVLCDYFVKHGGELLQPRTVTGNAAQRSYVRFDPLGVVLAIMPWNFPFWQVMRFAIPALFAGNSIVLKHATNVLGCAEALEKLFVQAGFPAGAFQSLAIGHEALANLIADSRVRAITLTGSDRAGRSVAKLAGQHLKPCVLELGGSDPFIVCNDADLVRAVELGTQARTINNGQSCIAAKRFLVQQDVHDEFVEKFAARMAALKMGDPLEEFTQLGPLARKDLRDTLHDQVQRTLKAGGKVVTGGQVGAGTGWYYAPTVITQVQPGMPAFDEETFGPVAAVTKFTTLDEAADLVNRSSFGLGASIFTRDIQQAEQLAGRIESGNVFINDFVKSDPTLPFGGVKDSGYGRELGEFGVLEFVNIKTVWIGK